MVTVVSVLIPTKNRHDLALRALRSVLSQTYSSVEVVVSDNSDTAIFKKQVDFLNDERIIYSKNKEDIGPILNWRRALEIASGEFCLILPDDDYFINPFYIEDAIEIINNNKIGMIIPDCILAHPERNRLATSGWRGLVNGRQFMEKGLRIPHIGNIFSRRMALELDAFSDNDVLWSDVELWQKIMSNEDVYCYSVPSIYYLFHDENIVLNMTDMQIVNNSKYLRNSVATFADDAFVERLVLKYVLFFSNMRRSLKFKQINNILTLNKLVKYKYRIYIKYFYGDFLVKLKKNILGFFNLSW